MTIVEAACGVTGGVDTHLDVHVAAALDPLGGLLGTKPFEVSPAGYKALLSWLQSFGDVTKVGVEGTSSYGTGLARFLRSRGIEVVDPDHNDAPERAVHFNRRLKEGRTRSEVIRILKRYVAREVYRKLPRG